MLDTSPRGADRANRVTIEGDNQKQAVCLAAALAKTDPVRLHDLHIVQSVTTVMGEGD